MDLTFWKKTFVFSKFNNPSFVLLLGVRASRAIHKPQVRKIFLNLNLGRNLSFLTILELEADSADRFEDGFIPRDKIIVFTGNRSSIFVSLSRITGFGAGLVFLFKVTV